MAELGKAFSALPVWFQMAVFGLAAAVLIWLSVTGRLKLGAVASETTVQTAILTEIHEKVGGVVQKQVDHERRITYQEQLNDGNRVTLSQHHERISRLERRPARNGRTASGDGG